jgi:hypothetical protein
MFSRIVSKTVHNDTLDLTIGFSANCCIEIRPAIQYANDTLFLYNKPKEADSMGFLEEVICMCDCCFEFKMQISGISDTSFVLLYGSEELKTSSDKYRTFPVRFNIHQGDTINLIDKYGFRQGVWRIYNQGTNTIQKEIFYKTTFYEEDNYLWIKTYRPNGTLEKYTEVDPKTGRRTSYNSSEYKALQKEKGKQAKLVKTEGSPAYGGRDPREKVKLLKTENSPANFRRDPRDN